MSFIHHTELYDVKIELSDSLYYINCKTELFELHKFINLAL